MFSIRIAIFLSVLKFLDIGCANTRLDPLVLIEQGLVKGRLSESGNYSYFVGIPYAKVDIDSPFGPSNPAPIFDGVYNAFESVKCPQFDSAVTLRKSIDCLNLNIYVPNKITSSKTMPVFMWVNGHSFQNGASATYEPINLIKHGIIVVTINYRLGAYGFMCLDTPSMPGNQGLKDQYEAFVWIRNNIEAFGGDPFNVTLGGHGAGSTSAILHLYSNNEKYYQKLILQSGTPQHYGTFIDGDIEAAIKLSNYLGFNTSNNDQALTFLAKTSHDVVTAAVDDLGLVLMPCKEKSFSGIKNFIDTYPFKMSNEKKIKDMPILIGHSAKEGGYFINTFRGDYFKQDAFYNKISQNFAMDDIRLAEAVELVKHFYIGDDNISESVLSEMIDFESDFLYQHPISRVVTALLKENASPIFQYYFNYVDDSGDEETRHFTELPYLFNMPYHGVDSKPQNELMVTKVSNLWANFIKYGNPTPSVNEILHVIWQSASVDNHLYLTIDEDLKMGSRFNKERTTFWDLFYIMYEKYNRLSRNCL